MKKILLTTVIGFMGFLFLVNFHSYDSPKYKLKIISDAYAQSYGGALVPYGTSTPATCGIGELFWDSDDDLLYICDPTNTWTEAGGGVEPYSLSYTAAQIDTFLARVDALDTTDTPQFTGIELGHASDTTLTRPEAGEVDIEGQQIYHEGDEDTIAASMTDLPADIVDSDDINWAEPITVPFDNKLQFGDTGIYIWADDDGVLDIVSDTTIESSAAWVHTGNFWATTYGSDGSVSDTELKYINTLSSNAQTQLSVRVIGDASVTDDHVATFNADGYNLQDTLVVISDAGAMTGLTSMTVDASATPGITGYDSDVSGDDVWKIYGSATDANDSVMYFQVEQANALVTYVTLDGVGETVDLAKPLDMGANAITTTGLITGGVKSVVDADGGDPDDYCYGGVWFASGTGEIDLPPVAVGMQLTVENHTANDVHIDPDASEVIRLNGVALTGGFRIIGTDLGDGCVLTYYSAGVWSAFCSGYEDAGS